MIVLDNGIYREATAAEISEHQAANAENVPLPTQQQRLEALESAMLELIIGG